MENSQTSIFHKDEVKKTNLIIKELHNGQKKKSLSMLNSLKIDISKDDFNEIKDYIENFKSN